MSEMNYFLGYGSFLVVQFLVVVAINKIFGIASAGMYYWILAVITPFSNFLSMALKQRVVAVESDELKKIHVFRVYLSVIFTIICITLAFVFFDESTMDYLVLISMFKLYEWGGELSLGRHRFDGNNVYTYCNVGLIIIIISGFYIDQEYFLIYGIVFFTFLSGGLVTLYFPSIIYLINQRVDEFETWLLNNLPKYISSGVGLVIVAINAVFIRAYVELFSGSEGLGVFGNILYGYILGLLAVNVIAIKMISEKSIKLRIVYFISLLGLMLIFYAVVLVVGEDMLALVFGDEMRDYSEVMINFYPVLCLALIGTLVDYYIINNIGGRAFMNINVLVLIVIVIFFAVFSYCQVGGILGGGALLAISACGKLIFQLYYVLRKRDLSLSKTFFINSD